MKRWHMLAVVALAAVGSMTLIGAAAAGGPEDRNPDFTFKQPSSEDMQKGMAMWMELGQPSIYHKRLEYFVGDWDTTTKMWMGGPGSPAQESSGTAEYTWMMEGRWLAEKFHGNMMGMAFEGFMLLGYDNYRREYVSIWVDGMSSSMSFASGRLDQTGKIITVFGDMDEPMTGELGKVTKMVRRIVDDNTFVFEIHDLAIGGDNTMVMEITYKRKA